MAVKAIIFDCFGVLVLPSRSLLYQAYPQFAAEISDLEHQTNYGIISREEFHEGLAKLFGTTPEEIVSRFHDTRVRNESVIDWARQLKSSGKYKLGLLSNVGHGGIDDFLSVAERASLFDEQVLSSDVGMVKPEIKIFELMAERLGVQPNECVMVDDLAVNIDGAESAGMQGVVFVSIDQAKVEVERLLEPKYA